LRQTEVLRCQAKKREMMIIFKMTGWVKNRFELTSEICPIRFR
jgi:hypothetical protein